MIVHLIKAINHKNAAVLFTFSIYKIFSLRVIVNIREPFIILFVLTVLSLLKFLVEVRNHCDFVLSSLLNKMLHILIDEKGTM